MARTGTRRRTLWRVALGALLSIIIIAAIGGYIAWRLSWQAPAWYAPPPPRDPLVTQRADDAEYRLLQKSQQLREPEETWTLTLTEGEINAWLASRLPAWIEHDANVHWPQELGTPQVLIEEHGVSLAVPVTAQGVTRTIVARLQPMIVRDGEILAAPDRQPSHDAQDREGDHPDAAASGNPHRGEGGDDEGDGDASGNDAMAGGSGDHEADRLALPLRSVSLGRVWIPGEPLTRLVEHLREAAPQFLEDPRVQEAIDVLAGRATLQPVHDLGDGRRVRLTAIRLRRGAIELTAQTLANGVADHSAGERDAGAGSP